MTRRLNLNRSTHILQHNNILLPHSGKCRLANSGVLVIGIITLLVGCSTGGNSSDSRYSQQQDSAPNRIVDASTIPDAIPKTEPVSRYGNPETYKVLGKRYHTLKSSKGYNARGIASWYGSKFHGHRTSSGEPYDMYKMSAAHKTLPLPTYAKVTNLKNGKSVTVKINDRGPFHENRLIDLSYAAATRLDILATGTGMVEITAIDPGNPPEQVLKVALREPHSSKPKRTPVENKIVSQPALYLQVGAFGNRSNAEQLQSRLNKVNVSAKLQITRDTLNLQPVYRVRVGPLETIEDADQLAERLLEYGVQSPHVVVEQSTTH